MTQPSLSISYRSRISPAALPAQIAATRLAVGARVTCRGPARQAARPQPARRARCSVRSDSFGKNTVDSNHRAHDMPATRTARRNAVLHLRLMLAWQGLPTMPAEMPVLSNATRPNHRSRHFFWACAHRDPTPQGTAQ